MRGLFSVLAILAAICVSAVPVSAAAPVGGFDKGEWAMTLSGGGAMDKDFHDGTITINVAPSYFVSDNLEIGIRQTLSYFDQFNGATFAFVGYNFKLENSPLVPFIGANIGYSYGESVTDAWRCGPEGGLKYFVNTTTFLYGNIAYEFDLNNGFDTGAFTYSIGVGFTF